MTPAYLRQLSYMTQRRSWADVSRDIGIPTRTIRTISQGIKQPDGDIKNDIYNAYRRMAYNELKDTGFSSKEARRWGSYRPEIVQLKTTELHYKIADLTTGLLGFRAKGLTKIQLSTYINDNFDRVYNDIKKGIQNSRRTTEEILEGDIT